MGVCAGGLGCASTEGQRESADREVYSTIQEKVAQVPGVVQDFDIEPPSSPEFEGLPVSDTAPEYLSDESATEEGAFILSLEAALGIAFTHSREYQNAKENLYLEALSLTLDRHDFAPIFAASGQADYARSTTDVTEANGLGVFLSGAPQFAQAVQDLTGTPAALIQGYADVVAAAAEVTGAETTSTDIMDERSVSGGANVGVNLLMAAGGQLALNLTTNLLEFLTGDPRTSAFSVLSGSFTQPLLRGAGRRVVQENLTQAERDLLYELRDFTRFRKSFAVEVAAAYYGVLQNRNTAYNNYLGLQSFQLNLEREQAFADEGQSTRADVGRFEQEVYSGRANWLESIRRYKQSLDSFKILLGLDTDAPVILDEDELDALKSRGIIHPEITVDEAVETALVTRLDLYTARDQVDDSDRRIYVAADALKPGLDLVLTGAVDSEDGNRVFSPDFERGRWSLGFDTDLNLDKKAERNAYRAALIGYERALRGAELAEDRIKFDVRDAYRTLEQERRNYEIRSQSVALNQRRVEEQELRAELDQGDVLDLVDAQNDLTNANINLTSAIVSHTISRLEFWRDIGVLFIKENGQWEEVNDVQQL